MSSYIYLRKKHCDLLCWVNKIIILFYLLTLHFNIQKFISIPELFLRGGSVSPSWVGTGGIPPHYPKNWLVPPSWKMLGNISDCVKKIFLYFTASLIIAWISKRIIYIRWWLHDPGWPGWNSIPFSWDTSCVINSSSSYITFYDYN